MTDLPDYDAGLLNDWGGGNVEWWQDYIRAEIGRANEHWREACADLIPRADAELAVSEAIRRAAERVMAARMGDADSDLRSILHCIEALAPADALAEVQRLREELHLMKTAGIIEVMVRNPSVADYVQHWEGRTLKAEAERDAALARVEKLRRQITEASDPDLLFGAMDNVNDMDVTLDQFAAAASRAIRAALDEDARHG